MLMRQLQTPTGPNQEASQVAPISSGGTSATNKRDAVYNLGGLSKDDYGQASGLVQLDDQGKIPSHLLPPLEDFRYCLHGPTVMAHGEQAEFFVTNYSHDRELSVTVTNNASFYLKNKDTIEVTAPTEGSEFKITVNGRTTIVRCSRPGPLKPYLEAVTTESNTKTFYSSPFRDGPRTYGSWNEIVDNTTEFTVEENVSSIWLRGQSYGLTGQIGALINGVMHAVNDGDTIREIRVAPGQRVGLRIAESRPLSYRKTFNKVQHTNTYWQISKDRDFSTVYKEKHATDVLHKWTVELEPGVYYMRFTHNVNTPGISNEWSDTYTVAMPVREKPPVQPPWEFHSVIDLLPYEGVDKTTVIDVDAAGDYAVIGNPKNGPVEQSFFSVYRRQASTWHHMHSVSAKDMTLALGPAKDPSHSYARSVKISPSGRTVAVLDTTVRVSANHVTPSNQEGLVHGCVYVCRIAGDEVVPEAVLTGDDLQVCSTQPLLSEDGNSIVFFANNVLHYYVYTGVQWTKSSDYGLPSHDVPWSVSATNDLSLVVVGYMSSNKVLVLKRQESGNYELLTEITEATNNGGVNFGYSVDISENGDVLVIGTPVVSNSVYGTGLAPRVDIYDRIGDQFQHRAQLPGSPGSMFGKSISLSADGKHLAVGSPNTGETEKFISMPRCGTAFYKNLTNEDTQTFRRDIEYPETEFGDLVCLNNMTLMIASRKRGTVFVYRKTKHDDTSQP